MSKSVFEGDGVSRVSAFKFDPTALVVKSDLNGRHELPDIEWLIKVWETGKLPGDAVVPQSVIDWLEALLKEI